MFLEHFPENQPEEIKCVISIFKTDPLYIRLYVLPRTHAKGITPDVQGLLILKK
jgi:hypothetical protein